MLLNFPDADLGPWHAVVPPDRITQLSGHPGFMIGEPDWSAWARPGLRAVRRDGPKAMPRFLPRHLRDLIEESPAQPERRRRGPKRIEEKPPKSKIAGDVAWRVDIEGHRRADVARWLDPIPKRERNRDPKAASIEKVARYLKAGRRLLFREGVLPWVLWPDGKLPREWYRSLVFSEGFLVWHASYVEPRRERLGRLRTLMTDAEDYVKTGEKPEQEEVLGQEAVRLVRAHLGQLSHHRSD